MVFEEKLLINTVGRIMGLETGKLDVMLVNAARYTARQFVERVLEHFPSPRPYALKEENLISYEQFQGTFERAKPQVSLLFNTSGSGYFAYCVIAPHLLEKGTVTPIQADNALRRSRTTWPAGSGTRAGPRCWWWTTPPRCGWP